MKKRIGIVKEDDAKGIVVLSPLNIKDLTSLFDVVVEKDAGAALGHADSDYEAYGARIVEDRITLIQQVDVLVTYNSCLRLDSISKNLTVVGFFDTLGDFSSLLPFTRPNVDLYSLDHLPRTSLAQSMDVLSSVASVSGYQAVLLASSLSPRVVPMITSAGGTLPPATFLIIGAGVAGLQAIATAKRLGAKVVGFDVRAQTKNEVESLGAKFIVVQGAVEDVNNGGYAVQQSEDYLTRLNIELEKEIVKADVIITTARIPGKKAPILIKGGIVSRMKPGAVIIDLAASSGGNCELTKEGEVVTANTVKIVGASNLLSENSSSVSKLLGNNFTSFLLHMDKKNALNETDEILIGTKVIEDGKVVHPRLIQEVENY